MSKRVVEQIEALQREMKGAGLVGWAASFGKLLAAAREQEQELAAMKEPKNVLIDAPQSKGICVRCGKPVEVRIGQAWHTKSAGDGSSEYVWHEVCSYQDAIEKLTKRHSADLREIAEMAIEMMDTHIQESKGIFTADQFLREFREKQHRETVCKVHGKHLCAECFPLEKKAEVGK